MKLNKRKFTAACSVILLVFLCAFSMVIAAEKKVIYTKYDEISSYRTGTFSVPDDIPEGYVFGGWYKTEDETTPLDETDVSGEAYAKFVPEEVLGLKAQLCAELTDSNATNDDMVGGKDIGGIRFVTSVDSKSYEDIGFYIAVGDGTEESYASKKVYTTLYEKIAEDGGEKTTAYVASELFASVSTYFKTWTFYEVPSTYYRTEFTVTPYWTTLDGTVVEGSESIRTVNQGRNWNYFYVNGEGSDTTGVGTLACPYATMDDAFAEMRSCVAYQEEAGISEELPIGAQVVYVNNEIAMDNVVAINEGDNITVQTYDGEAAILRSSSWKKEFFNVKDGAKLTLKGDGNNLILDGNKSNVTASQTILINAGTCEIGEQAILQNNLTTSNGGAVYLYEGATLTVNGGTLQNNEAPQGGAINLGTDDTIAETTIVTLTDAVVKGNKATEKSSGAIFVAAVGEVTIKGNTEISSNHAATNGGVANVVGKLYVQGGDLTDNHANGGTGGAIHISGGGFVDMSGGTISQSTATSNGGAIHISGSMTMSGGSITENSTEAAGGGIYIYKSGRSLTVSGGNIDNNTSATIGGGIYVGESSALTMTKGSVDGNTAYHNGSGTGQGGGIYAATNSSVEISGGSISSNTAENAGGAMFLSTGSTDTISDAVSLSGVTMSENSATNSAGAVYVGTTRSLAIAKGASIDTNTAGTNGGAIVLAGADSELTMTGGSIKNNISNGTSGGGGVYMGASSTFELSGGNVDGNEAIAAGGGIYTSNSSTLTISGGSVSDNTAATNGGGIYSTYRAYITTTGGSVNGNTADKGGALYLAGGKDTALGYDVSLTGVTMDDNEGSTHSGGVYLGVYRKLSINQGTEIINNTSGGAGGGVYLGGASSVVEMTGGSVSGNDADGNGGGLYATNSSSLTISGGNVNKNTTAANGGGIYATYLSDIEITGGSMNSNSASSVGGGLALASGTATTAGVTADISGVTISSNTTESSHSGGVFVGSYRTMNMGEGTVISDNTSGTQGGGITLAGTGTVLNMTGGTIKDNTAGGGAGGGGVYISTDAVMNMTGGAISDNTINDEESQLGDGIYAVGALNVGGSANISNMIYLNWAAKKPITVTSALTKDAYIGYIDPHDTRVRSGDVVVVNEVGMDTDDLLACCGMGTNYHRLVTSTSGLALSSDAYLSMEIGDTTQIPMIGTDFWSYNDEIASVDEDGVVTANGKGNTVICFTQDGHERTYGVMVDSTSTAAIDISTKTLAQKVDRLTLTSDTNVQQGLGINSLGEMYVVQRWTFGSETTGDLIVNRVGQDGKMMDYMYLADFGHGNTIAVEHSEEEDKDYIWIGSNNDGEGYSSGVSRILYDGVEGILSTSTTPAYTTTGDMYWNEGIFAGELQIAIDEDNGLILFREGVSADNGGGDRCWIYDLKAFVESDPESALIFRLDLPEVTISEYETADETQSFQGVDFAGGYVYKYIGRPNMGIYIQTFDMTGTCLHTRKVTGDVTDVLYREAEGLAIYNGKIHIGIAEGDNATMPYKAWANIYCYD